jgi:hypothetical protein
MGWASLLGIALLGSLLDPLLDSLLDVLLDSLLDALSDSLLDYPEENDVDQHPNILHDWLS